MNNKMEIGTANISYDENGKATSVLFVPSDTLNVIDDPALLKELKTIPCSENSEDIRENAQLAMGAWWAKLNEIELADRNEWRMDTDVIECVKWPNGRVQMCSIRFVFQKHGKLVSF